MASTKFMDQGIYVIADDGSRTDAFSSGFMESKLYMAFTPPTSAQNFKLFWPDNSSIELKK